MAAVNKMKLMDILEDEDGDGSEEEGHGGGTRPATRASKRSAVIQSSSDSDEASQEGINIFIAYLEMFCVTSVQMSNVT